MTEQAVEIIIQVKIGAVGKEIREDIPINNLMSGITKLAKGFTHVIAAIVMEVAEQAIHVHVPKSWINLGTAPRVCSQKWFDRYKRHIYEDDKQQRQAPRRAVEYSAL